MAFWRVVLAQSKKQHISRAIFWLFGASLRPIGGPPISL